MPAVTSQAVVVVALALLLGIQPVTTDLYLPALPQLTAELGAPMAAAQQTMAALMASFGIAQLMLGPVADRYGRRPVLLGGLALYVVASIASTLAPSIDWLIAARAAQGIGVAASVVCARAMVRDLFQPYEGAHVMSQALSGLGVIALGSPALGGFVAAAFGWRAALLVIAVFGAATLALVAWRLGETAPALNPRATLPRPLVATYARILGDPTFRAWTLLTTCTYAGLYAFLAGSSFVYISGLGVSRQAYGLLVATSSVAYLAGTFACRRWLLAHGARGAVRRGALLTLAGGALYAVLALAGAHTLATLTLAQALYAFGHGIHQPCSQAGIVGPFPANAGAASALSGFVTALAAFAMGTWLGQAMDSSVAPYALTIAAMALATTAVAWTLVQRHGDPLRAPRAVTPVQP
jgi:DHA1 family bicyclomycin/chloramphenicol resistance-like MFS transporter